ncbi:MAG: glycosyltransferase [Actinobacteria bacterium]|nr:glycosyltransferase [Actinomycetota bacterium]
MRILSLAWNAATDAAGTIDADALDLAQTLARRGNDVHLLAAGGDAPTHSEDVGGIDVHWVGEAPPVIADGDDALVPRVLALNTRAFAAAATLLRDVQVDVLLAQGWQTTYAAIHLRQSYELALLAVLDGTTHGCAGGDLSGDALLVHQIEWWLTYEARRVVAASRQGAEELRGAFQLPPGKVEVIAPPPRAPDRTLMAAARRLWRRRVWADVADAYAGALAQAIADERELRGVSADGPPLRQVLLRALDLEPAD